MTDNDRRPVRVEEPSGFDRTPTERIPVAGDLPDGKDSPRPPADPSEVDDRRDPGPEPMADAATEVIVDPLDVAGAIERRSDARRVADLMRSLPDSQRRALVAVTLWGLSTREVSEMAGIPQGTVKTRVRLALRKLRDEMGAPIP